MSKRYAMVFDAGTGAGRCMLFSEDGKLVASAYQEWNYRHDEASHNKNAMLFDPQKFWKVLSSLCRKTITHAGVSSCDIAAVVATSQREGMVYIDHEDKELYAGPSIDLRGEDSIKALHAYEEQILTVTGLPLIGMFGLARLHWFRENAKALYERVHRVLMISDWITWRLSGEAVSEPSIASSSQMFDVPNGRWATELLESMKLRSDIFPRIVLSGNVIGTVTPMAAEQTGLAVNTPVVCGGGDTQLALLGMNVLSPGQTAVVAGTTSPVMKVLEKCEIRHGQNCFTNCHAVPGIFLHEANAGITGLALRWVRDVMLSNDKSYEIVSSEAASVLPGSDGMRCYIGAEIAGRKSDTNLAGFIFPMPWVLEDYTRGHFFRAAFEANAFAVRANLEALHVAKSETLSICGGQSCNTMFVQLLADVTNCHVETQQVLENTGLGAAVAAFTAVGIYSELAEASKAMSAVGKVYDPHGGYEKHYQDWIQKFL